MDIARKTDDRLGNRNLIKVNIDININIKVEVNMKDNCNVYEYGEFGFGSTVWYNELEDVYFSVDKLGNGKVEIVDYSHEDLTDSDDFIQF